ncbi:hypothetical protein AYO44_18745 [Planctomycetaceae bacterium SCGC AG-212-F19]|nr:hypothetical protein AYO44_18745 [Planctomycetaceae bacterium SCGC AG-212-F19]
MTDLVRRLVVFDSHGMAIGMGASSSSADVKVLALPQTLDPRGLTFAEVVQRCRESSSLPMVDYRLADYLPAYSRKLISDLEASLATGACVYLWETLELRLVGYPFPAGQAPWTDTQQWYQSAHDTLLRQHPFAMESLP